MRKGFIIIFVAIWIVGTIMLAGFIMSKTNTQDETIVSKEQEDIDNSIEIVTTSAKEQEDSITKETYIIKEKDGYIAIYIVDEQDNEILKETTQIVTKYLPDIDKSNLKNGIKVTGKEELISVLENYE